MISTLTSAQADDVVAYLAGQKKRDFCPDIESGARTGADLSCAWSGSRAEPQNYMSYWGGYDGHHFSELKQINSGPMLKQIAGALGGNPCRASRRWSPLPLVVDGIMYVSGPPGDVYALDAKSGLILWHFHRKQDVVNPYQIKLSNRGVAVLDGRVFFGTLDDNLIALDAHTGRELWEVRIADTLRASPRPARRLPWTARSSWGRRGGEMGLRGFWTPTIRPPASARGASIPLPRRARPAATAGRATAGSCSGGGT